MGLSVVGPGVGIFEGFPVVGDSVGSVGAAPVFVERINCIY